jgi:hypothetical protein
MPGETVNPHGGIASSGTQAPGARRAEALDFDRSLVNSESVFRYLSHKVFHDAGFMHFINMTAVVAYCEDGGVMPVLRVGAGHVGVH